MFSKILLQNVARNVIPSQFYSHRLFSPLCCVNSHVILKSGSSLFFVIFSVSVSIFDEHRGFEDLWWGLHALSVYRTIFLSGLSFRIAKKTRASLSACDLPSRRRCLMEISCNGCQVQKQCNEEFEEARWRRKWKRGRKFLRVISSRQQESYNERKSVLQHLQRTIYESYSQNFALCILLYFAYYILIFCILMFFLEKDMKRKFFFRVI